jgi:energy-coupling factor transporter ATP-binding protein EcfA2
MIRFHKLQIRNFRSIDAAGIVIEPRNSLVLLVGKNNAGKSTIADALHVLLGSKNPRYASFSDDDYNDPTKPIELMVEFGGLQWGDGAKLGLSQPQCAMLTKPAKGTEPGTLCINLVVPQLLQAEAVDHDAVDEDADQDKKASTITLARKHVVHRAEPIRSKLVKCIQVPALRDQADLLSASGWTTYGAMLRGILQDSPKLDELHNLIQQTNTVLTGLLSEETKALTATAKTAAYVDAVNFKFTKEDNPSELLRNLTLSVLYGGRADDISRAGTGTQSAVIIGMLELALRHRASVGIRVFCVEEPELFLHPQAQRRMAALLRQLAAEPGNFVFITTHSPEIVLGCAIEDVFRIERGAQHETRVWNVTEATVIRELERKLTRETAEMVFADRVVFTEGESEPHFLPLISGVVKDGTGAVCDYDARNISAVKAQGKSSFTNYTKAADSLGIAWRVVTDADALDDNSLHHFCALAQPQKTPAADEKRAALRKIGVAVLTHGEIEDYYPHSALAAIAGCTEAEVSQKIIQHGMRQDGSPRKTGDILKDWLRPRSKPEIARLVGAWIQAHPGQITDNLRSLIRWTVD